MTTERQTPKQRALLEAVKAAMEAQGLTYRQAATMVGCSTSNLSRILGGQIGLSARIEQRLISSFSIDEAPVESLVQIVRGLGRSELKIALQFLQILQRVQYVDK